MDRFVNPGLQRGQNSPTPDRAPGARYHTEETAGRTPSQYASNFQANRCDVGWKRNRATSPHLATLRAGTEHTSAVLGR